jgi:hypothetical protein
MEPIFSAQAQVVGWYGNEAIYDPTGQPRARVRAKDIFSLNGQYLGRIENGYVRDARGDAVAFMKGAVGAPITPSPRVVPTAPNLRPIIAAANPRVKPYAASASTRWSEKDWETFLSQPLEGESDTPEEPEPFVWS